MALPPPGQASFPIPPSLRDRSGCPAQDTASSFHHHCDATMQDAQSSLNITGPGFSPLGDFHYSDSCWRSNTAKYRQSRRFLESFDDPFLTQVGEDPTRNGVLLNFTLRTRKSLVGHVRAMNCPR